MDKEVIKQLIKFKEKFDKNIREELCKEFDFDNFEEVIIENSEDWIHKVNSNELSSGGYNYPPASYQRKGKIIIHQDIFDDFYEYVENSSETTWKALCSVFVHELMHVYLSHEGGYIFAESEANEYMKKNFPDYFEVFKTIMPVLEEFCQKRRLST